MNGTGRSLGRTLAAAFPHTVPVLTGYLVLGMAYGVLMASKGYNFLWSGFVSAFAFCGSMQYVAITLLTTAFDPLSAFFLSLMVNARHLFFSLALLPKYRGSAPIQWAVLNGDEGTGVTIMQLDEGLDTGDVLVCEKIAIGPEETSGELFDRVTAVGARVLCEVVPAIAAGTLTPQPQDHANATLAPMLNKEMAEFRLTESAAHIHNWVRGMNPWPCAWFVTSGGKKVKVMECRVVASQGEAPGTVLATKPLTVACADGGIQLLQVVPEGKKPMDGTSFAAGLRLKTGDVL